MTRTLVTGATGTLGSALVTQLSEVGHTVRGTSRSPPVTTGSKRAALNSPDEWAELDLESVEGVERAVEDVDVVVHAASDPMGDSEAVDAHGTERLVDAAASAGVGHFVYVSIVGVDEIPYSYYEHKLTAERAVEESDVPGTVLRATQFHQFVDQLIGLVARSPVWPLPTDFQVQPVDAREVADALTEIATNDPQGRVPPVGGPEVRTGRELVDAYREARNLRRLVLRLPLPGDAARGFRAGKNTCPDRAVGEATWESWLAERYGESTPTTAPASGSASNG